MTIDWTILRDSIWDFIGTIIGAIALLATIIIYFLQTNKRALSYEIVSKTSLLSTKEKLEGKLKISYNEILVQNIKIFELKIINTGQMAIAASDYERPLRFLFSEKSNVLATEIIETSPKSLITELSVEKNNVIVKPILMNAKDYIIAKIVVADYEDNNITTDVRIRDVKDIKKIDDSSFNLFTLSLGFILTIAGLYQLTNAGKLINDAPKTEVPLTPERISAYILLVLGYIIIIIPIFIRIIKRRSKSLNSILITLIEFLQI